MTGLIAPWLRGYRREWLGGDLLAGAVTAAVVVPQAMAYATIAGLPVEQGLYCALVPMAVYALLGTSRPLSVSTTSTISLLTAGAIATAPDGSDPVEVASMLALETGAILLVAGVLRLGFVSDFISRPVLTGFKIGMGLTICVGQLGKVLGIEVIGTTFFPELRSALEHLGDTDAATLAVSAGTIAGLVGLKRFAPGLPAPLVVLGVALVVVWALDPASVATVGHVPSGLPTPDVPDPDLALAVLPAAFGVALMAFVESIAAGRAFRGPQDPPVDPDRELVALGAASLAGGFFRAYPSGGGLSQTAVNDRAGARSQAAGLCTAGLVAVVLLLLAPLVEHVPEPALGGIVLVSAAALLAQDELRTIHHHLPRDWVFALITLAAVLLVGTLEGILTGVAVSLLGLLWSLNHPPVHVLGRHGPSGRFRSVANFPDAETDPDVLVVRIDAPLYFGNSQRIFDRISELVDEVQPRRAVVLDLSRVTDTDTTTTQVLEERRERFERTGLELWMAGLDTRIEAMARRGGTYEGFARRGRVAATVEEAVARIVEEAPR